MNSLFPKAALVLIVSTLLLGSCDKKPLSSSGYVTQANAVCASVAARAETPRAFTTPAQVAAFVHQTQILYNDLLDRLGGLRPPTSLDTRVSQMLTELHKVAAYLPQLQKAVSANDQARTSDLVTKIGEASSNASQIASELGLQSCVNAGNVAGPSASVAPSPSS